MTRTEQLNRLFTQWEASKPGYAGNFSRDGIVSEESYEKAARRLLFILKEPNDHHDDLREHAINFAKGTDRSYATWRNLAYWSYGLLRGFPGFTQVRNDPSHPAVLHEIAVMNLKKSPGGSAAIPQGIIDFARDDSNRDFIRREVAIIEPQIVDLLRFAGQRTRNRDSRPGGPMVSCAKRPQVLPPPVFCRGRLLPPCVASLKRNAVSLLGWGTADHLSVMSCPSDHC
jgi:hypothetical protein